MLALIGLSAPASADPGGTGRSPGAAARVAAPAAGEPSGKPAASRSGSAKAGDKASPKASIKASIKASAKTNAKTGDKTGDKTNLKAGDKAGKSGAAGKGHPGTPAGAGSPAATARSGSAATSASAYGKTIRGFARTLSTHARPASPALKPPPPPPAPWLGKNTLASPGTATVEATPSPGGVGDPLGPIITSIVETATTFAVAWTPVPGATSYLVSVNGNGISQCTVSPCTFSNLIFPGVNRVVVYAYVGGQPRSSAVWLAQLQAPAGVPQVTSSRTGTDITITYAPAVGETGIDAYETDVTVSGSNPAVTVPCTVATATTCTIAGQAGTSYQVKVRAHNSVGWSSYQTITATVPPVPPAPTAQATVSGTTVTVTWAEQLGVTGITGHTVLVNRTDGGSPVPVTCNAPLPAPTVEVVYPDGWVSGSSCTFTGVVGATYSVEVRSYNSVGPSTAGTTTAVLANAPAAPAVTTSVSGSSITVNWTPGNDGGAPITSYVVTLVPQSAPLTPTLPCAPPLGAPTPPVSCTATGVPGQTYDVAVSAVNVAGTSTAGTAAAAVAAVAPAAPTVTAGTSGTTITVNWTPNATGGAAITAYQATLTRQGMPATVLTCTPATPTSTTCSTTGAPGSVYDVVVTAANSAGTSLGGTATATVAAVAPSAPTVSPTVSGSVITVAWTPNFNGGAAITSYVVTLVPQSDPTAPSLPCTPPAGGPTPPVSCTATGTPGETYDVAVVAVNSAGSSTAGTGTITAAAVAPAAPTVTAASSGTTITVNWSPNATGGAPISAYQVTVTRQGTPATVLTCVPATPTGTTCSATGVPGATYDVAVTAQNNAGVSVGGTASVTLEAAVPAAPAVSASVDGGLIKVAWTPGETGGAPILSYTVTVSRSSGAGPASPECATASPLATTCSFSGIPGAGYTVSVAAVNVKGASPTGTASVTAPAVTAPVVTVVPGDTTIDVTWTVPQPAGAVTGYTVTATPATGSPVTATVTGGSTTSHKLTGVTNKVTYQVTVAATVAEGDATASAPLAVTPAAPVTVPATVPPTAVDGVLTSSAGTALPSAGQPTVLVGTGFAPRTWVQLLVFSSPTALGTALTDENGSFSKQVTVPAGLAGQHTFVSMGTDPSGTLRVLKLAVTVGAAPADVSTPSSGGGLPVTGPSVTLLTLAALALIVGGAASRVAGSQMLAERLRFRRRR
ncbi:fibronectin type III domain-containing protein [Dactylosporangium sp. NPDC006015]|uniref:fibronectin type III domain-containing protein n=1 Tax=Dactylosporangium sp. NPDC006015 TaxID=3154576 RepID=UPI0033B8C791